MKIKKYLFLISIIGLFLIIVSPIIVNLVITRNPLFDYRIAGESKDWIGFYGTFLGSVLASIVAYVVMIYTIKNNEEQTKKTLQQSELEHLRIIKHEELIALRNDLSNRIANINYPSIIRACQYPFDFNPDDELNRLDNLYYLYQQLSNSSLLAYGTEKDFEYRDFNYAYNTFLSQLCKYINELTIIIWDYKKTKDKESFVIKLNTLSKTVTEYSDKQYEIVFNQAERLYRCKRQEYDAL